MSARVADGFGDEPGASDLSRSVQVLCSASKSSKADNAGPVPTAKSRESLICDKSARQGAFGYSAATGEYGDMVEMGTPDPTKVICLALLNAAWVAGLLLTTEVMIAESPTEDEHAHGAPGSGMGGVGGMSM